jgi:wobble nucleotide-excising tRNase
VYWSISTGTSNKEAAKEFIRRGLELVKADCPFCGQDLNNAAELLKAYQEFFDDTFRTYQKELEEKAESLSSWNLENALTSLASAHHANTGLLRQWEPFVGAETLPDVAAIVDAARSKLSNLKAKVHAEREAFQSRVEAVGKRLSYPDKGGWQGRSCERGKTGRA